MEWQIEALSHPFISTPDVRSLLSTTFNHQPPFFTTSQATSPSHAPTHSCHPCHLLSMLFSTPHTITSSSTLTHLTQSLYIASLPFPQPSSVCQHPTTVNIFPLLAFFHITSHTHSHTLPQPQTLHCLPQVVPFPLLLNDVLVDATCGDVVVAVESDVQEALIVAQV